MKSPAGVPWKGGIGNFIGQEQKVYADRLAQAWLNDQQRVAVLASSGFSPDKHEGALKIGSIGLWCSQRDALMAAYPAPQGRSIRRMAGLHKQAFLDVQRMPLTAWVDFMKGAVLPMLLGEHE